jgi:hypothetical protein
MKFIEKLPFFMILGPSIEPEKPSVKSASTPYPPSKVVFIAFFINSLLISVCQLFFNLSRPNLEVFAFYFGPWYCIFTLPFFGTQSKWLL